MLDEAVAPGAAITSTATDDGAAATSAFSACRTATALGCAAEFDGDGALTLADFAAFRGAFLEGDGAADFDGDGELVAADFGALWSAFRAGCP